MKHDEIIYARVPKKLRKALERERKCRSIATGAEVKTSAVIREILEWALLRNAQKSLTTSRAGARA